MADITVRRSADIKVWVDGITVCLELTGELSLATAYPLMRAVQTVPRENTTRCSIDLSRIYHVAPGGIEALQDFLVTARTLFGEICLMRPVAPMYRFPESLTA